MNCCGRLNQATSDYFVQMADVECENLERRTNREFLLLNNLHVSGKCRNFAST